MNSRPQTLVELLRWRAEVSGLNLAYVFSEDGEETDVRITYAELDARARAIAADLVEAGAAGERALLLYPPGLEFIAAFFGCLYAGTTAVPAYPPRLNRPMPRIQSIVRDAEARFALTTGAIHESVEKRFEHEPMLGTLAWWDTTRIPDSRGAGFLPDPIAPDEIAFLQYTSGSTSTPKGVMLTHGNLIHNLEMIRRGFQLNDEERSVFWLPSYHDMGLIGGILEPMNIGCPSMLISPVAFLQRPNRWLEAITRFKATVTGAPNFAYDLCVDKITPEQIETLDLRSLRLAFTGAEPVRAATMARFAAAFSPAGYHEGVLYPCYGLAEASLLVTGGDGPGQVVRRRFDRESLKSGAARPAVSESIAVDMIGCGQALPGEEIRIVDPESLAECGESRTGEIWVKGDHIAAGYWGLPELTAEVFRAHLPATGDGPFLRTGDLGFLLDGELFVTGRLKDLIIIRGKNHYPQDIEETCAAAHPALEKMGTVAFSYEDGGAEKLAVVAEVTRQHRSPDVEQVAAVLRRAVAEQHGVQLDAAVLVRPLSIPKTSSGKIKRQATRQKFLDGALSVVGEWRAGAAPERPGTPAVKDQPAPSAGPILDWLLEKIAATAGLPAVRIDPDETFAAYGLDSAQAVSLTGDLETFLGRSLSPTLAWDYPTPRLLAGHLSGPARLDLAFGGRSTGENAVALVGMACRLPGAEDPEAFWRLLEHGIDAIREVPAGRFDVDALYDPDPAVPGKLSTRWGGFLTGIDQFDPQFFGISPREAERMDPQQRLLMEIAWEALEAAGIPAGRLAGSQTGVYIGISSYDYSRGQFQAPEFLDAYAGTGNAHSIAANRLSYFFDLRGPSVAVDTACSSSLVSVHMACRSLASGEIDLALAGGVNLILSPELTVTFSQARMLAADGRCKTFDAAADGYVRGEGAGIVVLKRLADALRDGDPVLAVIRGSAVNQDGRSNGLTAPNGPAQEAVILRALSEAGIAPQEIGYVEAHGTGTPLGDPIEMHALHSVLAPGRDAAQPLRIGSVKTNIGHLEAAAGIAGLIKTVLALKHEAIPPHLHLTEINPYISWGDAPFEIPTRVEAWPRGKRPRIAGVSSFGFGGTNAHIVLEEAPQPALPTAGGPARPDSLLVLSARSPEALRDMAQRWRESDLTPLADAAYTSQIGRRHFEHRLAVVAGDVETVRARLHSVIDLPAPARRLKIGFLFTGQGAQHPGMARRLYAADPTYRHWLEECARLAAAHLEIHLLDLLLNDDDRIHQTRFAQPALFAVEYAMARMWQAWGIVPEAMLGHSIGEWVAACLAGVVDLADAVRIVCVRGRLMGSAPGEGGMLAVLAEEAAVAEALAPFAGRAALAAVNGPDNLAVSGEMAALQALAPEFERCGWTHRFLNVSHGFHSPLMDPVLDEFRVQLAGIAFKPPRIPIAANADGLLRTGERPFEPDYWVDHIRRAVRFGDGVETLLAAGVDVLLEIGPRPTLTGVVRRMLRGRGEDVALLASGADGDDDWAAVLSSLGRLYELGVEVDWQAFNSGVQAARIALPGYPFQRQRYWLDPPGAVRQAARAAAQLTRLPLAVPVFEIRVEALGQPRLVELALAAAEQAFGPGWSVETVQFSAGALLGGPADLQIALSTAVESGSQFSIHARRGGEWEMLAGGLLTAAQPGLGTAPLVQDAPVSQSPHPNGAQPVRVEQGEDIPGFLRTAIARTLGIPAGDLRADQPLNLLGLDSLMAIELRNLVEKQLGIEIAIARLLEGPTLAGLAELVRDRLSEPERVDVIPVVDPAGPHPLTHGQQALWFLHELTGEDASFNIAGAVRIRGGLDPEALASALRAVLQRHPALRTTFHVEAGEPVQRLHPDLPLPLVEIDARAWPVERIAAYLRREAWRKFNLEAGPPFRMRVLHTTAPGGDEQVVLLSIDHIVADFWSVSLLVRDLLAAYQDPHGLPPAGEVKFVDAARWRNRSVEGEAGAAQLAYWREQFSGGLPALDLPLDRPRPALQSYHGETVHRRLPAALAQRLQALAQAQGATLFHVLLAGFQALLGRTGGQEDFVVGSVLAGRDRPELEELAGYLINPVALRADLAGEPSFLELLERARRTVLEAFEHQDAPPALLAKELDLSRGRSRPPLFETMFIFQKAQVLGDAGLSAFAVGLPGARVSAGGLDMAIEPLTGAPAQFDLTLMVAEAEDTLLASLQYNTALFDESTARRMLAQLELLLEGVSADPALLVGAIPLVPPEEAAQIDAWNAATRRNYPQDLSLQAMFAAAAGCWPEKTAVVFGERSFTYAELDERSDAIAAQLQGLGVGAGALVGVNLRRSLELPAVLLGILKAEAAYVPLDPAFPAARIEFMIEDSGCEIIMRESGHGGFIAVPRRHGDKAAVPRRHGHKAAVPRRHGHKAAVPRRHGDKAAVPRRHGDKAAVPRRHGHKAAVPRRHGDNAAVPRRAYVIYTSGSTGRPKGVQIPQRAVANFMQAMQERPGIGPEDVLLAVTTLSFDISVLELFLPLVSGARLVIADEEMVKDGAALAEALERHGATVMQATPATWRLMIESGWDGKADLRALCGGEAMPADLAAELLPRCAELWNMYGPTETTIWSTCLKVEEAAATIGIGSPIANTTAHILDGRLQRVPLGVYGELCIGGRGVADGYLNRPELTAEKFIELDGEQIYRTGDQARRRTDGTLEIAGRADAQVKLRGFRIELGEIETQMSRFPGVAQAVVGVQGSGTAEARLVGYAVLQPSAVELDVPALRRHLGQQLPEYMVPALFVTLDALPLTPNGKLDRKALPAPEGDRPALETPYMAPRSETEARLAALCAETLGLERVGVRDNFFDLGGTSLQATRLVFRLRDEFGQQVLLRRLFEEPTVEGLARALEEARGLAQRGYGILERKPVAELLAEAALDPAIEAAERTWAPVTPHRVLLTGATGYLGAFLLRELLDQTEAEVVCLVRAESGAQAFERIRSNLEVYGLWDGCPAERIVPLPGDLEKPLLGLGEEGFSELAGEVDAIYHNGARVNFVHPYEGHRASNVQGTHEILRLASTGELKPVHFVSTLSVFHTGDHGDARIYREDDDLVETGAPLGGYAQSKWVAEKLVGEAARRGIPAAVYRPGIISGHSQTGAWNQSDLVWGLARACFTLGKIPALEGVVDVVPVDYVSRAIVHLSLHQPPEGCAYHLGNPGTYPFAAMVDLIRRLGLPVDEVPFEEWRTALFRHSLEGAPGEWGAFLPIIEEVEVGQIFMPRFDVTNTVAGLAGSGIECPPVGEELLGHYLAFFNSEGFFSARERIGE